MIYFQMTALYYVQLTMVDPHHEGLEYSKKGQKSANFLVITCKKKSAISPYTTVSYCWLMLKHPTDQMETNNYFESIDEDLPSQSW